jgi:hypothetical protein
LARTSSSIGGNASTNNSNSQSQGQRYADRRPPYQPSTLQPGGLRISDWDRHAPLIDDNGDPLPSAYHLPLSSSSLSNVAFTAAIEAVEAEAKELERMKSLSLSTKLDQLDAQLKAKHQYDTNDHWSHTKAAKTKTKAGDSKKNSNNSDAAQQRLQRLFAAGGRGKGRGNSNGGTPRLDTTMTRLVTSRAALSRARARRS